MFDPLGSEEKDVTCIPLPVFGLLRVGDNVLDVLANKNIISTRQASQRLTRWRGLDWMTAKGFFLL